MMNKILTCQRGFASLIAVLMVVMLTLIGLAMIGVSEDEVNIAGNELQDMRAFYAAEAGLEKAASVIQQEYELTNQPPLSLPSGTDSLNACYVAYNTVSGGPASAQVLSTGTLTGLHALVRTFNINSIAVGLDGAKAIVSQSFEVDLVPIFQFAVFYGNDLEIAPGPEMTLIGRVHSNGNLWVQANNQLRMDSYVTASGNFYHGRKGPGGVGSGEAFIKDTDGNYVSMRDGSGWLDADSPDWYDESIARWGGRVQDAAHGQPELNLPLANAGDPHSVIEPGAGNPDSYEHKATLKFIDGSAYQKVGGVWNDVTADMVARGIISYAPDKFKDQRENEWVDVTELDVGKMYDEGYGPDNGVIYFSDDASGGQFPALRLNNGDRLDDGLTIASANPVYTVGDYNSTDKKPAAILADAVTFLSGSWNDSKSSLNKSNRVASETTVNASYLTGNVETTATTYNGGFENLPRFLEVWSGINFNWCGSAVNLWNSEQANGNWSGTYYSPPNRNWQYDTDLDDPANLPPETPSVRIYQRSGWKQEFVGFES